MSETSEGAEKKPRARKTTTMARAAAKTPKSKTVKTTPETTPAETPAPQEPVAKTPRKRTAPKSAGRKTASRQAAASGQPEPAEPAAALAADQTPASMLASPISLITLEISAGQSDSAAAVEEKPAARKRGAAGASARPGRRSGKKPPPVGVVEATEGSSAPEPAPATLPVQPFLEESPAHAGPAETAGDAAPETAGEGGQPREKSRRSRSRRGRRKSAARAVAQARQTGEPAENSDAPADAGPFEADGLDPAPQREPIDEFDWFDEEDESGESEQDKAESGAEGKKAKGSSLADQAGRGGKGGQEPEKARQKRKMFVSVLPGEQVEVVLTAEGQVQEYYVEMLHQVKIKGNIYKGVVHNVDANLQAAFVSYGAAKNGFLQIDEVHPEYYLAAHEPAKGHKYPLIQKVLKPGQEILVQVVKEPSGSKGAFLTSYLSLAGRFLVLTPGREQIGVSRKVDSEEERARLRELLSGLNPGEGLGVIVRTVSSGATKTNLQKDLQLLKRVWKDVRKKGSTEPSPCLIYQELGLDTRAVRDYLTDEVTEVWIDDEEMAEQIRELASVLFPRKAGMVQVHKDLDSTLFERFGLRKQLEQVHSREVTLPSGGQLVFDHTEALMAIDINSGRSAGKSNFEDTAFKTNLEAAQQIPLQLRLRDIGGQIVVDFIEMRDRAHWREVEKAVRNGMKTDRARHDIGKISSFGLMEIVRQRLSTSAISTTVEPCPCCKGTGQRRNLEWQALQALREIRSRLRKQSAAGGKNGGNGANGGASGVGAVVYSGNPELILYLLNSKRERLSEMEKSAGLRLELKPE